MKEKSWLVGRYRPNIDFQKFDVEFASLNCLFDPCCLSGVLRPFGMAALPDGIATSDHLPIFPTVD
jgi:hypothetical protein